MSFTVSFGLDAFSLMRQGFKIRVTQLPTSPVRLRSFIIRNLLTDSF